MYDDNELMALVQAGDQQAYEKLVLKYRLKAIAFANSFVHDPYTAEDIVQECFVKIYIKRTSYRPTYAFNTYLFTAIRNSCIDFLRANKSLQKVSRHSLEKLCDGNTPEEVVGNAEDRQHIFEVLNQLHGDYRTALYLYAVADFSYKDIARTMKKNVPQVKILLYRARKKFKKQYEIWGGEEE